ncbi:baseplate spike protein [Achromobacter phage Mano]|uniref:Baseplate spike protein n=1 Tax=Achromobacter phage Mano TaxID=2767570 RepID=A0A7L8G687_9CAUD|nr:baseplate assembly protein [Achromobacter phage Mano]QOE32743.1 baseplate spike protein [Achromobacter phage Mano]
MSYQNTEADRRLSNIVRLGTIESLDEGGATVTVNLGDGLTTTSLPWVTLRAGPDRTWWAPEPGEQVVVLSPSGDLAQGVVLPAVYQDAHPAPANSKDVHRVEYQDGSVVQYDRAAHQLLVDVSAASGSVLIICNTATVQAAESVTIDTPETTCTGNLTVQKKLTYLGGMAGSNNTGGKAATITGGINFQGGELTHDGKNVGSTHTHSGVQPGGGNTGAPN